MNWFFVALLGYILLGIVFVLDKFILDKSVSKPVVYTFYSTIFMFAALLALPFGVEFLVGVDWIIAAIAGIGFGLGLWWMYKAVSIGETSHMSPFIGAGIIVFIYALSRYFLGEELTNVQIVGIVLLVCASLLLSFEKSNKHNGFHKGFLWGIAAAFAFAISHVASKYIYDVYDFFSGFIWTRAAIGLVGIMALAYPSVWKTFKKKKKEKSKVYAKRHVVGIVASNKILGVVAVILIQYAIALGSVTLVNAMAGLQYAFMFLLIIMFTKFAPKVFKETFTKKELLIEWMGMFLIVIGSALFVL
ncbi:MAG: EamA family transporter [Candidatus Magasanikbacteria bacterium]|jgi:drug/metabolite transporter (DMT)-like permease|nr:EamA family transporter [Candidatus Magasanikbacteria bacterium]